MLTTVVPDPDAELHRWSATIIADARSTLKPSIPTHAANGLPIRDELEYRLRLG